MPQTENLTVMFTDIVGFTERTSRQSRAQNRAMLRDHNHVLLPLVARFGGRRVKSMGDSLMLGFRSPTDAVRCGMAMHDALAEYNFRKPETDQLHIRVAINVGEVRVDGSDIFGEAVNVASRVEGLTPPDQIYFTEAVYLSMNKAEVPCTFAGKHKLKGIPEPVKLFTVPPRQVQRLVPGGEDLGNAPGELPFGGMHRAAPTVGRIEALMNVVRDIPPLQIATWREWAENHGTPLLAVPPSERLTPLLATLLVTLVVAWWVQRPPDEFAPPPLSDARVMTAMTPATGSSAKSAPSESVEDEATRKQIQAKQWLQRGHVSFERNRRREAAPAYGKALDLQPALQDDPLVAKRLVACLSWASDLAIPLIKKYPSSEMIQALAKRTAQGRDQGGRRAADLLNELGFADRIDPYFVALTALDTAKSCEDKRAAIGKVRALHDPRTLPALKATLGSGIGGWFKSNCFRSEANEAIAELEKTSQASKN
jgi:class 3 adenylate cyclase